MKTEPKYHACKAHVFNRGTPPDSFLDELIAWGKTASDDIFAPNAIFDIYSKVKPELGPYESLIHRKAVMLEVMRVLAGFESSWKWKEGVDVSRLSPDTPENKEAGAWQVSYDARRLAPELASLLKAKGINNGVTFQRDMKTDHPLAMEFVARLMRHNVKHNGPLYKGEERKSVWPKRPKLWTPEESIYPWLRRAAVSEFRSLL